MYIESSGIECSPPDIDNRRISDVLNTLFRRGDQIDVFEGAKQISATGVFVRGGDDFFLWLDRTGSIRFQYLGGAIGIRKVNRDFDESLGECPSPDYNES